MGWTSGISEDDLYHPLFPQKRMKNSMVTKALPNCVTWEIPSLEIALDRSRFLTFSLF